MLKKQPPRKKRSSQSLRPIFKTSDGDLFLGNCEDVLKSLKKRLGGKVQLILTSPPFPLKKKKRYGNLNGKAYIDWLSSFAPLFAELLTDDGSIVIELGNAWEPNEPVQSLLPVKSLLAFVENKKANLKLCQEFICFNPARLPSPAQWVTVERIRAKDSFTRLWWMAKTTRPAADNSRVLKEYSKAMKKLLARQQYNSGKRPSEHVISKNGFLRRHRGAIPPNVITADPSSIPSDLLIGANTGSSESYQEFCRDQEIILHPARMPRFLAEFFIKFLTKPGDLLVDPFSGSNTVGAVAEDLGRRWLSVEAREEYAIASVARFNQQKATSLIPANRLATPHRTYDPL
jgi:site-specific DNA-methyltransferase (cytosine-N4-specific)